MATDVNASAASLTPIEDSIRQKVITSYTRAEEDYYHSQPLPSRNTQ
jgi:hypothetical protein